VNKSLDYIHETRSKMGALIAENAKLRQEVDELRGRLGLPALPTPPTGALYGLGQFPTTTPMVPLTNYVFGDQARQQQAVHLQQQQHQQQQSLHHHQQTVSSLGVESAPEESSTASSEASGEQPGERRESSASAGAAPAFSFNSTAASQGLGMAGIPGLAGVSLPNMYGPIITPEYLSLIQRAFFIPPPPAMHVKGTECRLSGSTEQQQQQLAILAAQAQATGQYGGETYLWRFSIYTSCKETNWPIDWDHP
jgi:hypothetical protein